ncbi:PAS domain S-box protein [Haloarchaeobius baliensis]|uniref:PAS domain S-box protein n=1 Tax=Haloarchaeobius baliensis TaxID=1670458 RepID=UPI003F8845BC
MAAEKRVLTAVTDPAVVESLRRLDDDRADVSLAEPAPDESLRAYLDASREAVDCLLVDDRETTDLCAFLRDLSAAYPALPVVCCPSDGSERLASEALAAGATDYVPADVAVDRPAAFADRLLDAAGDDATSPTREAVEDVLQRVTDAFYALDTDWRVTFWNAQMAARTGRSPEEVVGKRLLEAFPAAAETELYENCERAMERQEPTVFETYYEPADYWLEVRVYPDDDGLSVYSREVTERKERELELERYEAMVETVGNGVYTFDEDYYFTAVNEAMSTLTGYDRDELVGMHASEIFDETDLERARAARKELLDSAHDVATVERDIRRADGSTFPAEIHFGLLPFTDEFRGTAGVVRDVTERKARQERLRRQNERLDEFASVVSHDLRNPINVASASLDIYRENGDERYLDDIETAHERMLDIVEDVLSLARHGHTVDEVQPAPLSAVASRAWSVVDTADALLATPDDVVVTADSGRLQELLENLFRNAREHATGDARGTADERTGADVADTVDDPLTVRVGAFDDGFYVEDDGVGIPEERREQVLEASYTTNERGTGFGLAIVEQIATAHGWTVAVTEGESGGARFEFTEVEVGPGSGP